MDQMLAEIRMFAGNFAPRGWAFCEGQLLSIAQNTALFSLIGVTYGGDGRTTFALPDLRGRVPMHPGTGPGLPSYKQGQRVGVAYHTLTQLEMPAHTHAATLSGTATIQASTETADAATPTNGATLATPPKAGPSDVKIYKNGGTPTTPVNAGQISGQVTIGNQGGNQSFPLMQPSLAVNFIIATEGIFPSRN